MSRFSVLENASKSRNLFLRIFVKYCSMVANARFRFRVFAMAARRSSTQGSECVSFAAFWPAVCRRGGASLRCVARFLLACAALRRRPTFSLDCGFVCVRRRGAATSAAIFFARKQLAFADVDVLRELIFQISLNVAHDDARLAAARRGVGRVHAVAVEETHRTMRRIVPKADEHQRGCAVR